MFIAREQYWLSDGKNFPRDKILFWSDSRIALGATIVMLVISLPCAVTETLVDTPLPNYNMLSQLTDEDGTFEAGSQLARELATNNVAWSVTGTITFGLFFIAINN